MGIEQKQTLVLAHWTYKREEWNGFIRWKKMRRGWLNFLLYYFFGKKQSTIPEITITNQKVWTNDTGETFSDIKRQVRRIHIRDTGKLNILEITYSVFNNGMTTSDEIFVPVPKGKLKEAIQLQENLFANSGNK